MTLRVGWFVFGYSAGLVTMIVISCIVLEKFIKK